MRTWVQIPEDTLEKNWVWWHALASPGEKDKHLPWSPLAGQLGLFNKLQASERPCIKENKVSK